MFVICNTSFIHNSTTDNGNQMKNGTHQVSSTYTSVAFDVFQKSHYTLAHLSEILKIPVKLFSKHTVFLCFYFLN